MRSRDPPKAVHPFRSTSRPKRGVSKEVRPPGRGKEDRGGEEAPGRRLLRSRPLLLLPLPRARPGPCPSRPQAPKCSLCFVADQTFLGLDARRRRRPAAPSHTRTTPQARSVLPWRLYPPAPVPGRETPAGPALRPQDFLLPAPRRPTPTPWGTPFGPPRRAKSPKPAPAHLSLRPLGTRPLRQTSFCRVPRPRNPALIIGRLDLTSSSFSFAEPDPDELVDHFEARSAGPTQEQVPAARKTRFRRAENKLRLLPQTTKEEPALTELRTYRSLRTQTTTKGESKKSGNTSRDEIRIIRYHLRPYPLS